MKITQNREACDAQHQGAVVRKGWQVKTIGDVCEVMNGGTPKSGVPEYWNGIHRWITPAEMGKRLSPYVSDTARKITDQGLRDSSARMLPPNSVIISSRAPIGHLVINTEPMGTNQGCKGLIPGSSIETKFLYYYLSSIVDLLNSLGTGATFKELAGSKLKEVIVPVPPLAEQRCIVAILDEAFESIAIAKANTEKNLQNARVLFESHLESIFTERGEGWVEKRLGDVCAIFSTLVDPRKEDFIDLIHVGAGNIQSQTGVFVDLKTAREEGLISGKFLFDESMVLYSKIRPYLMKAARPDFNGLCSADMYPLSPLHNQITRDYLFHLLLSKPFTDYAIRGSARAGMPKVNREHLFEFRAWLPRVKKQMEQTAILDALHDETQRLAYLYQKKLTALDDLKKSLLHQAFSGAL
ncbi:MAG: restriction endonuclease subunit S [Burkholderiales bacterium]|jgi:type I restriction enzyme S subunit|nr:restriction endonuclease subunit S [Burkholderiales bacterium]MCA3153807.1 restriction endonuclease subunit S [Burkholderiales bacterium]MCA3157832.1 restriction endonuclease subunit S [Burkholderiales bacterium]